MWQKFLFDWGARRFQKKSKSNHMENQWYPMLLRLAKNQCL